eukprot:TRINITY_DN3238_c1_g1_i1.p1 TRINITY_DN3238_c1_g1~~TRINITY_DN3238_c1_g1_i1.p1  ORF type:complete len:1437 (-),score=245.62 TRINITY_DN3238_c1_g1_i1:37-3879(-)
MASRIDEQQRGLRKFTCEMNVVGLLINLARPQTAKERMQRGESEAARAGRLNEFWDIYRAGPKTDRMPRPQESGQRDGSFGLSPRSPRVKRPAAPEPGGAQALQGAKPSSSPRLPKMGGAQQSAAGGGFGNDLSAAMGIAMRGGKMRGGPKLGPPLAYPANGTIACTRIARDDKALPKIFKTGETGEATPRLLPPLPAGYGDRSPRIRKVQIKVPPIESSQQKREIGFKSFFGPKVKLGVIDSSIGDEAEAWEAARQLYVQECDLTAVRPLTEPFITGHSSCLDIHQRSISDEDMVPLIMMVQQVPYVTEVNFRGNRLLTDRSMLPFLRSLHAKSHRLSHNLTPAPERPLLGLDLSDCRGLGKNAVDLLTSVLANSDCAGLVYLRHFSLNGVYLPIQSCMPLAEVLGQHARLQKIQLAGCGLGSTRLGHNSATVVSDILRSSTLEILNLGWNVFDKYTFNVLGDSVTGVARLALLYLPACSSSAPEKKDQPIEYFLEHLSRNATLKLLDISMNHIDYRGALMVEDALQCHKLTDLIISTNPLGSSGMRCLMRLLAKEESGLLRMESEECIPNGIIVDDDDHQQVYNFISPGGRYTLDLERPYHRTLLRMLAKTCEHFNLLPTNAFIDTTYSLGKYEHPTKKQGLWEVASKGILSTTLAMDWAGMDGIGENNMWEFGEFLKTHLRCRRIVLGHEKGPYLIWHWKLYKGRYNEQKLLLDVLAKDFLLSYAHIKELCCEQDWQGSDIHVRMLHCIDGGDAMLYMSMLLLPSLTSFLQVKYKARNLMSFNPDNPTWRYSLNLGNQSDFSVAEKLLLLNRWEARIETRLGRTDTSEFGNRSFIRNATHRGRPLPVWDVFQWVIPDDDVFEFDYVTAKRPQIIDGSIDDKSFAKLLKEVQLASAKLDDRAKIQVLRPLSALFFITALQLRQLLGMWETNQCRSDCALVFFFRVVDIHNEKVFRGRFDDAKELTKLTQRLGYVTFFPFIQPEFCTFDLSLSRNDQRIAVNIIVNLMQKEDHRNLRDITLYDADGHVVPLERGIPPSWASIESIPTSGRLRATYVCPPENRKFAVRKGYFEQYGHWKLKVKEEEVLWWSNVTEAPADVLEFTEFLIARYPDIHRPFKIIDGVDGNGEISYKEFLEGYHRMGCQKFRGPDETKRVEQVFRYLDPGGEGTVSRLEWMVLQQLWTDILLCLEEFVQFLVRIFNYRPNTLKLAWRALDEDGSGSITQEEWHSLVSDQFNYFGSKQTIFNFLDKDDEGSVSLEEFLVLERFLDKALEAASCDD